MRIPRRDLLKFGGAAALASLAPPAFADDLSKLAPLTAGVQPIARAEYVARTNLSLPVPYRYYTNCQNANQSWVSRNGLGRLDDRPVWELVYNHYVVRRGLSAPHVQAIAQLMRPEHGSADIGPARPGDDHGHEHLNAEYGQERDEHTGGETETYGVGRRLETQYFGPGAVQAPLSCPASTIAGTERPGTAIVPQTHETAPALVKS